MIRVVQAVRDFDRFAWVYLWIFGQRKNRHIRLLCDLETGA
jgi:hypothetical protein